MAKVHTYTKYVEEPNKVVVIHLNDDDSEIFEEEQSNGTWKEISSMVETISQTLENSRPGSKFPLFHRIGGEIPVSTLEVTLLEEELKKIKTALKKMPLNESRIVKFRKGKSEVKQITEKELETFQGIYKKSDESKPKNLFESHQYPIDLHMKMCRLAKKSGTGLSWKVLEAKQIKRSKPKKVVKPKPKAIAAGA